MNFLFHMLLSGDDEQILVGNFMGDFVKGPLNERFPERIRQGIHLHRRIDSFSSRSELFQQSRRRIDPHYGLYRGVMIDLFYDHFLVKEWNSWSKEPFSDYLVRTREVITKHYEELPERMQKLLPYFFEELLPSYGEVSGIGTAFERMSRRVTRTNPLAGGEVELERHFNDLRSDFRGFMPLVRCFAEETMATNLLLEVEQHI